MVIRHETASRWTATVMDRNGRRRDSLRPHDLFENPIALSRDGRLFLVQVWGRRAQEAFDILAYRVGPSGRIAGAPDTVLRQLRGEVEIAPNGTLLLATGPMQREVWAMRREGPERMRFTQRLVQSATSELSGVVSPTGDRILLQRIGFQGDQTIRRFSVIPFDDGPETSVATPADVLGAKWSWDGKDLLTFQLNGDTVYLREVDPATGRSRLVASLWTGTFAGAPHALSGGGIVLGNRLPSGLRRVGAPGLPDTIFTLQESPYQFVVAASPDGKAAARLGFTPDNAALGLDRVSLLDGSTIRLASFPAEGAEQTYWLNDGTLLLQLKETSNTLAWYRLPATGGTPLRLGVPPRYPAEYSMSLDGRHVVANVREDRRDIHLIRNFAELLRR